MASVLKTVGISPKVLYPALLQLVAAVANLIASDGWTKVVQAQVISLVVTTLVGFFAHPGVVTDNPAAVEPPHPERE